MIATIVVIFITCFVSAIIMVMSGAIASMLECIMPPDTRACYIAKGIAKWAFMVTGASFVLVIILSVINELLI